MDAKSKTAIKRLQDLEKQADGTEKSVKKIGESSKRTAGGIDNLTKAAAGFLAVLGGMAALKHFVLDSIASGAALDRLSRNLGLNVETISAWGNAVEQMGGSAKGLQGTMDMLSRAQTELRVTGTTSLIPYFSALGIALSDVHGKALPVDNILLQLATRFEHMDRTQANNIGRMIGIDQDTLNLLLQGRKELELTLARQKENTVLTKKQAEEDVKLQKTIVGLKQEFAAFGRGLLQQASPALEGLLGLLKTFGDWAQGHQQFIGDFLKTMAVGLAAIALWTIPINLTVLAILALAAGIALLWDDYQTWKKGGKSFIDWGEWEPGIKSAIAGIKTLRDLIKDTVGWLVKLHDAIPDSWAQKLKNLGDESKAKYVKATGGAPGATAVNGESKDSLASRARVIAEQVSKQTGVSADLIYAAFAHETGNFTNRGSRELNNLAGINVPGGHGQDYEKFDSLQAFGNRYAQLLNSPRYAGVKKAKTADEYASALKAGGYYSDSESNYAKGMKNFLPSTLPSSHIDMSVLDGIKGASAPVASAGGSTGAGNTDKSVSLKVDNLQIVTQATDAKGIAAGIGDALQDYLFTSQANTGLQ
jgi:hypothetical protein